MDLKNHKNIDPLGDLNRKLRAGVNLRNAQMQEVHKKNLEREEREIQQLEYLKSIKENTDFLSSIHQLLINNEEEQAKILKVLQESLEIAKAKNSDEAESIYRRVLNSAKTGIKDAETMMKVMDHIRVVYNFISSSF